MAVFTPNDAFAYCKTMIKSMRLEDIKLRILFDSLSYIWHAAPWEWTIGEISQSPLTITAATVDYVITVPNDFSYLQQVYVCDAANTFKPLAVRSYLPAAPQNVGEILEVAKVPGAATLRTYPKSPATIPSTNVQKIVILYKKTTPNLTASDYASTTILALPDDWFYVYCSAVLYQSYLYADDDRAGNAIYEPKGDVYRYTGQRAIVEANLQEMRQRLPLLRVLDVRQDLIATRA
jgi:hypothetical protein